jgi:hypothetical protein
MLDPWHESDRKHRGGVWPCYVVLSLSFHPRQGTWRNAGATPRDRLVLLMFFRQQRNQPCMLCALSHILSFIQGWRVERRHSWGEVYQLSSQISTPGSVLYWSAQATVTPSIPSLFPCQKRRWTRCFPYVDPAVVNCLVDTISEWATVLLQTLDNSQLSISKLDASIT